jgi:hypothetical protein
MSREANDFYPTPHSILDILLHNLHWPKGSLIWEPCAGDGRVVDKLKSDGYSVISGDIQTGQDFFNCAGAESPFLLTNPPFKHIRAFIDHAFSIGVEHMALVCPERLWACKKGSEQMKRHKPSRFINLDWREDYLNKGGTPDRALAVSIWDTPNSSNTTYEVWSRLSS